MGGGKEKSEALGKNIILIFFFLLACFCWLTNRRFNQRESERKSGNNHWSLDFLMKKVIKRLSHGKEEMVRNKVLFSLLPCMMPLLAQHKTKPRGQGKMLDLVIFPCWEGRLDRGDDRSAWLFRIREGRWTPWKSSYLGFLIWKMGYYFCLTGILWELNEIQD